MVDWYLNIIFDYVNMHLEHLIVGWFAKFLEEKGGDIMFKKDLLIFLLIILIFLLVLLLFIVLIWKEKHLTKAS